MIRYGCSACGKEYSIGDEFGGREAKCPECGNPLVIPVREQEVDPQKILEGFSGRGAEGRGGKGEKAPTLPGVWKTLSWLAVVIGFLLTMLAGGNPVQRLTILVRASYPPSCRMLTPACGNFWRGRAVGDTLGELILWKAKENQCPMSNTQHPSEE